MFQVILVSIYILNPYFMKFMPKNLNWSIFESLKCVVNKIQQKINPSFDRNWHLIFFSRIEYSPAHCLQSNRLSSKWSYRSRWPIFWFRTIVKFGPFKLSKFESFGWSSIQPISVRHEWWLNGPSAYSNTTQYHWRKWWIFHRFWTDILNGKFKSHW